MEVDNPMDAREFLRALWGDMPQSDGPFIQTWVLAERRSAYYASAAGVTVDGETDVFTGVALSIKRLGAGHRAKAHETAAIAGLWLDLDVGPGKFTNRTQALSFANHFKRPTITVDSGTGGIHAYYLFAEPWRFRTKSEQARAGIIAQQWVALHQREAARRPGAPHVDSVGDLARILRLPGTINSKNSGDGSGDGSETDGTVTVLEGDGPRYTYSELALLLRDMPIPEPRTANDVAAVPGDASLFAEKLDALLANSPEFTLAWAHVPAPGRTDLSPSAWDLCLCSLAAAAMNDAELEALMRLHRDTWGYDQGKLARRKYVDDTRRKARSAGERAELRAGLARRAA